MAKIDADLGKKLSLEEVWLERDKDWASSKTYTIRIPESERRFFERELGHPVSWREIEKILHALLSGKLKVR